VVKQRLSRDDDLDQHAKDQVKTNREDLADLCHLPGLLECDLNPTTAKYAGRSRLVSAQKRSAQKRPDVTRVGVDRAYLGRGLRRSIDLAPRADALNSNYLGDILDPVNHAVFRTSS